tara:strand:+ start:1526 stop:1702 length:177 start_codon:yes stop_codon:yes gene_type:complete
MVFLHAPNKNLLQFFFDSCIRFELIISKPLDLIDLLISSTKEFFTASGFIIQSVFSIF